MRFSSGVNCYAQALIGKIFNNNKNRLQHLYSKIITHLFNKYKKFAKNVWLSQSKPFVEQKKTGFQYGVLPENHITF